MILICRLEWLMFNIRREHATKAISRNLSWISKKNWLRFIVILNEVYWIVRISLTNFPYGTFLKPTFLIRSSNWIFVKKIIRTLISKFWISFFHSYDSNNFELWPKALCCLCREKPPGLITVICNLILFKIFIISQKYVNHKVHSFFLLKL